MSDQHPPAAPAKDEKPKQTVYEGRFHRIVFQKGSEAEVGKNGMSVIELLELAKRRVQEQQDKLPCEENKAVIDSIATDIETLKLRKKRRKDQQLHGTTLAHKS